MRTGNKVKGLRWLLCAVMVVMFMVTLVSIKAYANTPTLSLGANASYTNAQLSGYGTINLNGYTLTVTDSFTTSANITLGTNGTLVVNGNMTASGKVDCGEGNLTVNGNYTQNARDLHLYSSRVVISGNAVFSGNGYFEHSYTGNGSNVSVDGNIVYSSTSNSSANARITWTIKGNITQNAGSGRFQPGSIILVGNSKQVLTLKSNSVIDAITPTNQSVKIAGCLNGTKLNGNLSPEIETDLETTGLDLNGYTLTLPHGLINTGTVYLRANGNLIVNGDLAASGAVDCVEGNLTVKGNYTQSAKDLYLGSSRVTITGNARFIGNGYFGHNYGNPSNISVDGNLNYSSTSNSSANARITWTIKGNITQNAGSGKFQPGNIILNGSGEQVLTLQSNSNIDSLSSKSKKVKVIGYLNETSLASDIDINLEDVLKTNGLYAEGHKLTLSKGIESTGMISPGGGSITVNGDVNTSGQLCGTAGGELTINGNLTQSGSYIRLEKLKLNVTGNVEFTERGYIYGPEKTSVAYVGGELIYNSLENSSTNDALWIVAGNMEQKSGTGKLHFRYLYLPTIGSSAAFTNGSADTIEIEAQKSKYSLKPDNCYTTLSAISVVTFDANGGTSEIANKNVRSTAAYGDLPTPTKASHIFDGWFTEKENGEQITAETIVTAVEDSTLYAHWTPYYTVTFDANGGNVDPSSVIVVAGQGIADLPTPELSGFLFDGWFTARDGGVRILSEEDLKVTEDVVLYAHWKTVSTVTMYRLYNPNSGEHFYTSSERERKALVKQGWNDEGVAWVGPSISNTPVYRLYNENAGDHHYTPSKRERDNLIKQGWKDEGIGWYSDDAKTKPLYRLYNPNATTGSHHYTTSARERDKLVQQGWQDEGIGWYGF